MRGKMMHDYFAPACDRYGRDCLLSPGLSSLGADLPDPEGRLDAGTSRTLKVSGLLAQGDRRGHKHGACLTQRLHLTTRMSVLSNALVSSAYQHGL